MNSAMQTLRRDKLIYHSSVLNILAKAQQQQQNNNKIIIV